MAGPDFQVVSGRPQRYTYDDLGNKKPGISDFIFDIDWREAPLLNVFGMGEENVRKFEMANWPALEMQLIEDGMPPWASTIPGGAASGDATLTVETGHGVRFRVGDLAVIIDGTDGVSWKETVLITSNAHVDGTGSADVLNVERAYADEEDGGATTAVTIAANDKIEIVSRVMPEGSDYTVGPQTVFEYPWNHVQILSEAARVTRSEQRVSMYGLDDRMAYEVRKLFDNGGMAGRLAQMLQKTFYWGVRQRRNGTTRGSMGGFKTFVTPETAGSNMVIDLAGAPLERGHIHQIIRGARDNGGRITEIIGGSWFFEVVLDMYEGLVRYTQDSTRGGGEITMIKTPAGEVELIYDILCPPGDLYFTNRSKIGWLPFDEFKAGDIAPQGDYFVSDVVGEYTFGLANAPTHGYITGMDNPDVA